MLLPAAVGGGAVAVLRSATNGAGCRRVNCCPCVPILPPPCLVPHPVYPIPTHLLPPASTPTSTCTTATPMASSPPSTRRSCEGAAAAAAAAAAAVAAAAAPAAAKAVAAAAAAGAMRREPVRGADVGARGRLGGNTQFCDAALAAVRSGRPGDPAWLAPLCVVQAVKSTCELGKKHANEWA